MNFPESNYSSKKFSNIISHSEVLVDKEFEDCTFTHCQFLESDFVRCQFSQCTFKNCILSAIKPTDSRFFDITFIECKTIGIDWTKTQQLESLSFKECALDYSNFRLLKIPNTTMIDCQAKEVDFQGTDMQKSNFTGTDFERSLFAKTNLFKADFSEAKNYFIDPQNCNIKKAKFTLPQALLLLQAFDIELE